MSPERAAEAGRAIVLNVVLALLSAVGIAVALAAIFYGKFHPFPACALATASGLVLGRCVTRARTILRYGL